MKQFSSTLKILLLLISLTKTSFAQTYNNIHNEIGLGTYYLHGEVFAKFNNPCLQCRALAIGAGAGNEVLHLIRNGWFVTIAGENKEVENVIIKRAQLFFPKTYSNRYEFKHCSPEKFNPLSKYDYIFAYDSLPFYDKKAILKKLRTIKPALKRGGYLVFNLYGENSLFVKSGAAFAVDEKEVNKLLRGSGFEVMYIIRREWDFNTANSSSKMDVIDVIARRK